MSSIDFEQWLAERNIDEVECLVPDMSGTPRGKILPATKFLKGLKGRGLRIPEEIFILTVTGRYSWKTDATDNASIDVYMRPDPNTLKLVPWYENPTAEVICDCFYLDDRPVDIAPRFVLQRVLGLYAERGWRPVVAPELEFYLVKKNLDPDYPLEPPAGRSGRAEKFGQAYGIDAANEFDPIVEDIYDFCEAQEIDIDTISHESGPVQLEINFNHGDPLQLADQVFLFKRTVRQAALKHDMYATFMAKPHADQPGSSMHIHQSVVSIKTGRNVFSSSGGKPSRLLLNHIGGLQRYMSAALPFFAPNVNSYRRLVPDSGCPHQHPLGHRQPHGTLAHADLRARLGAYREPGAGGRCQPLSGHRRLARLRVSGHGAEDQAHRSGGRLGLPLCPYAAAAPGRGAQQAQLLQAPEGGRRYPLHRCLPGREGRGDGTLPQGDQLVGARVPAPERLSVSAIAAICASMSMDSEDVTSKSRSS